MYRLSSSPSHSKLFNVAREEWGGRAWYHKLYEPPIRMKGENCTWTWLHSIGNRIPMHSLYSIDPATSCMYVMSHHIISARTNTGAGCQGSLDILQRLMSRQHKAMTSMRYLSRHQPYLSHFALIQQAAKSLEHKKNACLQFYSVCQLI